MPNEAGTCGPVACVDKVGNPLKGYVRNNKGVCMPKNCGNGYVFNYATGNCVSQNSHTGQELLRIKKVNDAIQAKQNAEQIIRYYKPTLTWDDPNDQKTYGRMVGDYSDISGAQQAYQDDLNAFRAQRQRDFEAKMLKEYEEKAKRTKSCYPKVVRPCAKSTSPWASFWTH